MSGKPLTRADLFARGGQELHPAVAFDSDRLDPNAPLMVAMREGAEDSLEAQCKLCDAVCFLSPHDTTTLVTHMRLQIVCEPCFLRAKPVLVRW